VLGHLAAIDVNPMEQDEYRLSVFRIFGVRAAAELERLRIELALRHKEEHLSAILTSAKDVVITIDGKRTITLFNAAAGQTFRCAAAWAMGQPFDRFLSRPFRKLLDESFRAADKTCEKGSVWAPQGLTALRADGEEFPIEVTISPFDAGGERFYTIILRDINERRQAEEALAKLRAETNYLKAEISEAHNFDDIVSGDPSMKQLFSDMEKVAATDSTVLILGETGTGKELVARAIHNRSLRRDKPLIKMNCAALPSELIESELFGHEKGAFTGATAQRVGRFELAHGGTLFLDEVGELSLPAQAKLLRVLQDQEFERVGGAKTLRVDVRVITATNRDLGLMVQEGKFRSDLYYRLNVFPLSVPPLRERISDIPLLVQHFLGRLGRKLGRDFTGIASESLDQLLTYSWPGNVRELQNVIERAAVLTQGSTIAIADTLTTPAVTRSNPALARRMSDAASLEDVERMHIARVLEHCSWVIEGDRGAAMVLGLNPSTLRFRMQKLGIRKPKLQPQ
jgi:PAS domain S-box-containing protein